MLLISLSLNFLDLVVFKPELIFDDASFFSKTFKYSKLIGFLENIKKDSHNLFWAKRVSIQRWLTDKLIVM
jgi:hypothetical protein